MTALANVPNILFFVFSPDTLKARFIGGRLSRSEEGEGRDRRDFVLDRMEQNSDAFATSYDVEAMQALYPDRF